MSDEAERLRDIIRRAADALAHAPDPDYLEWLAGRLGRMDWEMSPPKLRAAAAATRDARAILAGA